MYSAKVNGQRLIFQVAGVYRRNLIIRDRQTGTLWQHATGEALIGPLKGTQLRPLGGELTRWLKWKETNPHTTLAVEVIPERGRFPGLIPRDRLKYLLEAFTTRYVASGFVTDRRLPMHEEIVGISLAGVDRAYPLAVLRSRGVIHDRIGEHNIAIVYDADADNVKAFNCLISESIIKVTPANGVLSSPDGAMRWTWTGNPLTANTPPLQQLQLARQWWLGWIEFHPTTDIWSPLA